jgi:putative transposase
MDFVRDTLADGRPLRILTVVDRVLGEARWALAPSPSIMARNSNHGHWKTGRIGVQVDFIRPRKSVENAFIESFNGRLRDECLNVHQVASLAEAQEIIEMWRVDDNQHRPHSSLGHLTPEEFVCTTPGQTEPRRSRFLSVKVVSERDQRHSRIRVSAKYP